MAVRALQDEQTAIVKFGELGAFEGGEIQTEGGLYAFAEREKHICVLSLK